MSPEEEEAKPEPEKKPEEKKAEPGKNPSKKPKELKPVQAAAHEEVDAPTEEEVTRKPRSPIPVPAAAMKKDHTDVEKVELPTFLNFPSEQGIVISQDDSPQVMKEAPAYPEEKADVVSEEESPSQSITESKPNIKVAKKKVKKKTTETTTETREIPIKILTTKVTEETVTPSEVGKYLIFQFHHLYFFIFKF